MIRYTPEKIAALRPNEIFVFGSNLAGHHGGGAASIAHERFGAQFGELALAYKGIPMQSLQCKEE